ncbi:MAG TPA: S8 family serine peptidase [Gemmatimonadaceae bacterium]
MTESAISPHVAAAWSVTRGEGSVLAVVDHNVDVADHPAFAGRTLPGYRSSDDTGDGLAGAYRTHGAKVAGLAVAQSRYTTGVAPEAMLQPVSVPTLGTGTDHHEAAALRWAADAGADVICCAWAPSLHSGRYVLPPSVRDALDYCATKGRRGKGCVLVFAAGNQGLDVDLNGYATHAAVIAVGACNAHGRRPTYSNAGEALWCVYSSSDPGDATGRSLPYRTTAPAGSLLLGESFYSSSFGFTSAACAVVAGICALIVSANSELSAVQVRDVLRESCEKVDVQGGSYDATGRSRSYGYGRPNALHAVRLAQSASGKRRVASV